MSLVERPAPPRSSPRPVFDGPALIRRADVTRHIWGDPAAGEVFDWIYASTDKVHMLVFGLSPGGKSQCGSRLRVLGEFGDGRGQSSRIADGHEPGGARRGRKDLASAARVGRNARHARGRRLQQHAA